MFELGDPAHSQWMAEEGDRLLDFGRASEHAGGGFGWLNDDGTIDLDRPRELSNVTFVEGLVHFQDTWFAYYGQSDSTLGVATYKLGETYGGRA